MNNHIYFHIVYDGPALESNEMDIKELAPALLAISEALDEVNRIFNRGRTTVGVNVKGSFKTGCFGIDLSVNQDLINNLLNIFSNEKVVAGSTLLAYLGFTVSVAVVGGKGLLHVIKWLRNRTITKIDIGTDGLATIHVVDDQLSVDKEILELLRSYKVRKAIEQAVCEPLSKEGVDSFYCGGDLIHADTTPFLTINKDEMSYFTAPEPIDEIIDESTRETNLQAVSVVFQEKNKWRFTDGSSTFFADIEDAVFAKRVQDNDVSFSKDDILRVELHTKQTLTAKGIRTEYTVVKVLGHRSAARQLNLPL